MKFLFTFTALPLVAVAFPAVFDPAIIGEAAKHKIAERALKNTRDAPLPKDPLGISKAQTNCGPTPCLTFDAADQYVSTTGNYAYASPATDDIRGPCPGLNVASNHGYLPRSGIVSAEETISGLGAMYNMAPELAAFLAAYAITLDGNIVEGVWSIGGPLPTDPEVGKILGDGQGLSYSHNNYEGDASIGRFDAYTNHGNAHSLNISKFEEVYKVGGKENRYTLDKFRQRFQSTQDESIANNPYYFTGLFSTVVVVPAAYNFVINFMSNHSAEEPSGYIDGYMFKKFFGVTGKPGSFVWQKGQEKIPENWYRRPTDNQYTANDVGEDVAIGYAAYPNTLKFGGNTGKVNSFTGLSVENVTGGVYDAKTLFEGDNFSCFAFQLAEQGLPDFFQGEAAKLEKHLAFLQKSLNPILSKLKCKQQIKYASGLFNDFPGYHYHPHGNDTNY